MKRNKMRFVRMIIWVMIIALSVIVCIVIGSLIFDKEPPPHKFSLEFEQLKPRYLNEFNLSLNKDYKQIDVYCKSDFVDTLRLDSLFFEINSLDKDYKIWMNVYNQDSMIIYTQYYVGRYNDSIIGKAMGGYQY
jgi:hypothetical protein